MDVFDAMEVILIKSAVKDLIPWKRVCKSWNSLISSPSFHNAHVKHSSSNSTTNKELGHIRIAMPSLWKIPNENRSYASNVWRVVGSSNGLVCISHLRQEFIVLVINPWTREVRQVPMPPLLHKETICRLLMSFGYDSSTDDYKVVMGVKQLNNEVVFQVLSLKSNTWKHIRHFKYHFFYDRPGILLNGALHWLVLDWTTPEIKKKQVVLLLSFNLSREEFTLIPQPNDSKYVPESYHLVPALGILDDQLCIYFYDGDTPGHQIWVMRNYNVKDSWELLPNDYEMKYQHVHYMKVLESNSHGKITMSFFCDDSKCVSRDLNYIEAHIFVPSLVSPFVNSGRSSHTTNNETSVKAWSIKIDKVAEGAGQLSDVNIRRFIQKVSSQERRRLLERIYSQEVGDMENVYLQEDGK